MRVRLFSPTAVALGAAIALTASLGGGCDSAKETTTPGAGGAGGAGGAAGVVVTLTPAGCGFEVASRPEYEGYAEGTPVTAAQPNIRRVRLGLGGNVAVGSAGRADPSTSIAFAWQTDDGTLASEVTWGPSPDPATWLAENRQNGATWLTPPGLFKSNGPARMHEAYLCGLTPGTTYYYRVGGGPTGSEVWSDVYSFTTTPGPDSEVTIAAVGDSRSLGGASNTWQLLQRRLHSIGPNVQIFSGDVTTMPHDQVEWEGWLDKAWKDTDGSPLTLAQTLTLAAHGNHDGHSTIYYANLTLPQDVKAYPDYSELFYSVDIGPVHVVVFDDAWVVAQDYDPAYAKVFGDWLEADLAAANKNRGSVPWIIATHHRAEFSSSTHGEDPDVLRGRAFLMPYWNKHKVDLLMVSHDHNYERSKPLSGAPEAPTIHDNYSDGTVYVVCAGAGAPAYGKGTSDFTETSHDYKEAPALGLYSVIRATKAELKLSAYELRADGTDPEIDTFTISK